VVSPERITPTAPQWPGGLTDLAERRASDGVQAFWVDGELPPLPGAAVVGSRRASLAGREVARRIGADLARRGITVVSGLARGVDGAAHRGCLEAGGRALAVLGCGLGVDYPPEHAALRRAVARSGAVVSEYEADDAPVAWRFPHRNRIIAALSRAVIVVEAGTDSGALSTARWAADLGREVLAVPGSILGPSHRGSNRLLRDGVRPYLDVSDLADVFPQCGDELPGIAGGWSRRPDPARAQPPSGVPRRVLGLLGAEPVHPELVARALGLGAPELAVLLGELELAGHVVSHPGGLISRSRW
jgi:DNA processing protein